MNLETLARAISGTNPPEGRPSWTLYWAPNSARNLTRVWSQPSSKSTFSLADLAGSNLRLSLAARLVRWGPDDDATGAGRGISGKVVPYEIV